LHHDYVNSGAISNNGVNIGRGAIVAARFVIAKNIPPYAVVRGVPAKAIKFK